MKALRLIAVLCCLATILTASAAAMVIGSLMSKPPKETTFEKVF